MLCGDIDETVNHLSECSERTRNTRRGMTGWER